MWRGHCNSAHVRCICASGPFVPSNQNLKSQTDRSQLTQVLYHHSQPHASLCVCVFVWIQICLSESVCVGIVLFIWQDR